MPEEMPSLDDAVDGWLCGAFESAEGRQSCRCTEPYGHADRGTLHRAEIDGELLAEWPCVAEGEGAR